MERLHAERVNTYHYRYPTTRGRVGSRRERRVDVVDSGDPPDMYPSSASSDSSPTGASASISSGWGNRNPPRWAMVETLPTHRGYSHPNR